ncbi:hypothetical protein BC936DRAFT_140037 [Jimgerdemannia flammicorona]|uniref:Guanine deaminase n=1 Tax=Jimgerdemannia flammicorona TaxID=994334 RepID=A0A433DH66_9FUNG|nr:hypothetical protein BC936DRAFT_140037 [Jimgerdemannia flammicorona]
MSVFHATIVHTPVRGELQVLRDCLIAVDTNGIIGAIHSNVPTSASPETFLTSEFHGLPVRYLSKHQFLMPGFIDTHVHAPQYSYTGSGTDVPLMTWLNKYAFPAERLLTSLPLARDVYTRLVRRLLRNGTTTALYFATLHLEPTKILADIVEDLGQRGFVGKASMDRNAPDDYSEHTADAALQSAESFIQYVIGKANPLVVPVITPRFIPTCSLDLLRGLADLSRRYGNLPIQSHISESHDEIAFVRSLHPELEHGNGCDTTIFDSCGLLTPRTVMAHGVHLTEKNISVLKQRGSSVAVCPLSNFYFANGIFPLHEHHLEKGLKCGLGTDVAGGYSPSMLHSVRTAVVASKALALTHPRGKEVEVDWRTAVWVATVGGARCLGIEDQVGTLEVGKVFDAVLVDVGDEVVGAVDVFEEMDSLERVVEKFIHLGDERNVAGVWVQGKKVV